MSRWTRREQQFGQVVRFPPQTVTVTAEAASVEEGIVRFQGEKAPVNGWAISISRLQPRPPDPVVRTTGPLDPPGWGSGRERFVARVRYGFSQGAQLAYSADACLGSVLPARGTFLNVDLALYVNGFGGGTTTEQIVAVHASPNIGPPSRPRFTTYFEPSIAINGFVEAYLPAFARTVQLHAPFLSDFDPAIADPALGVDFGIGGEIRYTDSTKKLLIPGGAQTISVANRTGFLIPSGELVAVYELEV